MGKTHIFDMRTILCIIIVFVLIVSLIPLFTIAQYNYAYSDDMLYGKAVEDVRKTDTSIKTTLITATKFVGEMRQKWQGTFSALFLMAIHPGVFHQDAYCITPYIMIFSLILSTGFLTHTLMVKILKIRWTEWIIITALIALISIQLLPSAKEGFFWYNGAVYYTFFHSLLMVLVAQIIRLFYSNKPVLRVVNIIIALLVVLFISGGNYATALLCGEFLVLAVLWAIFKKNKNVMYAMIAMLAVYALGMYISISAPGNAVRQVTVSSVGYMPIGPVRAIVMSFVYGVYFMLDWFDLACVALIFAAVIFVGPKLINTKWDFKYPLLVVVLTFCIFSSQFTPTSYAASSPGPYRLRNVAYYWFLILLLFDAVYITGWAIKRRALDIFNKKEGATNSLSLRYPIILMIVIGVFFGATFVQHGVDNIPSVIAIHEMRDGTAENHAKNRISILNNDEKKFTCEKKSEILS